MDNINMQNSTQMFTQLLIVVLKGQTKHAQRNEKKFKSSKRVRIVKISSLYQIRNTQNSTRL